MVINSATVQQSIINATQAMCPALAPYEDQCRSAIGLYSPVIFKMIDKYFQPDAVCQGLRICPSKAEAPRTSGGGGLVTEGWRQELRLTSDNEIHQTE